MPTAPSGAVFRAFADQTRRDILKMLRAGPHTSGQIADRFDSSWPTISRHLSVLANADLVVAIRRGSEVYLRAEYLRPPGSGPAHDGVGRAHDAEGRQREPRSKRRITRAQEA